MHSEAKRDTKRGVKEHLNAQCEGQDENKRMPKRWRPLTLIKVTEVAKEFEDKTETSATTAKIHTVSERMVLVKDTGQITRDQQHSFRAKGKILQR